MHWWPPPDSAWGRSTADDGDDVNQSSSNISLKNGGNLNEEVRGRMNDHRSTNHSTPPRATEITDTAGPEATSESVPKQCR